MHGKIPGEKGGYGKGYSLDPPETKKREDKKDQYKNSCDLHDFSTLGPEKEPEYDRTLSFNGRFGCILSHRNMEALKVHPPVPAKLNPNLQLPLCRVSVTYQELSDSYLS